MLSELMEEKPALVANESDSLQYAKCAKCDNKKNHD